MSKQNNSTDSSSTGTINAPQAEFKKTQKAAAKATSEFAEEMAPEKIVVDEPPPKPDYPRYRVHPGQPISLATLDPNASEKYKKKKHVEKELEEQRQRLKNLQERLDISRN